MRFSEYICDPRYAKQPMLRTISSKRRLGSHDEYAMSQCKSASRIRNTPGYLHLPSGERLAQSNLGTFARVTCKGDPVSDVHRGKKEAFALIVVPSHMPISFPLPNPLPSPPPRLSPTEKVPQRKVRSSARPLAPGDRETASVRAHEPRTQ